MSVIDDYLHDVAPAQKAALQHIREVIKQAAPEAEEVITYGMPGFKYKKKYLVAFAPFKDHMSIFPGASPVESLKDQLAEFKQSKGTIQFTLARPLPDSVVKELVRLRVAEIDNS